MKLLRKLYYRLIPTYRRLQLVYVTQGAADKLLKDNLSKPEHEQWVIAHEETENWSLFMVYLEHRERILY